MPIPEDVVRVHLNWQLGVEEIAVSTFTVKLDHIAGAGTNWQQMTDDLATKTYDAWSSQTGTTLKNLVNQNVSLRDVSAYHLDSATGHTLHKGVHAPALADRWKGLANTCLPLECSVAVSIFGYHPGEFTPFRGRKRGRMYLPPLYAGCMDSTDANRIGRLSTSAWTDISNCMGGFFNDMHQKSVGDDPLNIGQSWRLGILSKTGNMFTDAVAVRVGDVMDVQRRRRNHQREIYKDTTITED